MNGFNRIEVIEKDDKQFPWYLANMDGGPEKLYFIGDWSLLGRTAVAVVGARNCSEYGRQSALEIGRTLGYNGVVTISGMARGIDGFAHRGALRSGGGTVAVLGCGADICYPASNKKLYEEICRTGLVVSQFPPGTGPKPWQFPKRNIVISALSRIVVVVEAGFASGSLITAVAAAEQGRDVMAVPGNINSIYSKGSNRLIADGAGIITEADDIIRALGREPVSSGAVRPAMGKDEKAIYGFLQRFGSSTVDEISRGLDMEPIKVSGVAAAMELKGLVIFQSGKIFIANF